MTPADGGEGRRRLDHGAQLLADFAATPLRSMAAVYVAFPAPLRSELGGDQPPAQGRRRYLSPFEVKGPVMQGSTSRCTMRWRASSPSWPAVRVTRSENHRGSRRKACGDLLSLLG